MLSKIFFDYDQTNENNVRILLNDGTNNKIIKLSLYCVKNNWYIDIYDTNVPLALGKILNTWIDLLEIIKIYHKNFPKLSLMVLPSNINGIKEEFNKSISCITQDLFLIGDSYE